MTIVYKALTQRRVSIIARAWGFNPEERLVLANAEQADELHGTPRFVNGILTPNWGTNHCGYYDAEQLLNGYLAEEARSNRCDALKARDFERDAYGA